jgi:hypothetical protein
VYRNDLHETLIPASLTWCIGSSEAQGVRANKPTPRSQASPSARDSVICLTSFHGCVSATATDDNDRLWHIFCRAGIALIGSAADLRTPVV